MSNANWNNPTTTSNYLNYSTEVKDRDEDLAIMFDGSTATNIPANTVRWNSTNSKFEKWDGTSAWGDLDTLYDISVTNLNGKTASSFLQLTGGGSQTITSGSLTISENSGAPLGLKGGTSDFVYLTLYADAAAQSSASSYYGFTSLGNQTLRVQNLYTNSNIDLITNGSGQVLSNGNQILDEGGGHSVTGTLSLGALVTFSSVNGVIFTNVGEGLEIKNGSTAGNPTLGGHSPNDIRLINLYDLNGPSDGALLIKSDLLTSGDAATELVYLDSSNFEWKGNQVVTEGGGQTINGSLTVGSFTSTGINDITTGKRLTVANGEVIFGTAGVDFLINQSTNDRFLGISGGNATSSGANILLYGGTHANTGDLYLRNDGNSFFIWDESTGSMQFYTGTGVKSSVLTLNSSQTAVFSGNITTQGNSVIHTGGGQTIAGTLTATTFSGNATTATTASTVTTAAQPSITSLGSLTGLTLNGSLTLNNHIISELNLATLDFRSGHSTISAIRFLSSTGSSLGYVYGEGNDIGFLNGTGSWQLRLNNSNIAYISGALTATGDITGNTSDERVKTNIKPITNALAKVNDWRVISYRLKDFMKAHGFDINKPEVGLIAQDIEKDYPELVAPAPFDLGGKRLDESKSGKNYITLKYDRITAILVAAIQELDKKIEVLNNGS